MNSEQIREMLEAATPWPWTEHEKGVHPYPYVCGATQEYEHGPDQPVVTYLVGMNLKGNQALIAAAPDLAAEVLRLREALEFYADRRLDGYDVGITDYGLSTEVGAIIKDAGEIARTALGDSQP